MSLSNQDKETIRTASKIFSMLNSEMQICKPNEVSEVLYNRNFGLMGMDCVANFNLLQIVANKLGVRKIYRTGEIAILFKQLKTVEVNENNVFIAIEKQGDRCQVVIFWTVK